MKMTIGEWYSGRSVLVTGGTGFMGKVLLEKLLRSCPGVERIFVLARTKRGCSPQARIKKMVQLPLFDTLRATNPDAFLKLVAIPGDITEAGLGLSEEDQSRLIAEVSVVFHGAASLRLEAGLKAAIQHNTVPTERLLMLAKEMPLLEAFIHISTAFCHCEEDKLLEKIYLTEGDPKDIILTVQTLDEKSLDIIKPRILGVHPNSYTFSKRLSETLVGQHGAEIHAAIVRPSIVLPVMREPLPGWVDTLNGPVGILVGAAKGVIRTMMCGSDFMIEVIPADIAINSIIAVAWMVGTEKPSGVPVINASQSGVYKTTWGEVLEKGRELIKEYPFEVGAWYPDGAIRTNKVVHNILVFLLHILPAYFIDFWLTIFGQERFMVRVQKRISTGLEVLQYFTMREWHFQNDRLLQLLASMSPEDQNTFYISNVDIDMHGYMKDILLGARQYCLKEPLSSLPRARKHMTVMYYLDRFVATLFYGFVGWLLFSTVRSIFA